MSQVAVEQEDEEELLPYNDGVDPANLVNVYGLVRLTFDQALGLLGLFILAVVWGCSIQNAILALTLFYYPDAGPGRQAWLCFVYGAILLIVWVFLEKILRMKKHRQATRKNNNTKKVTIGTVRQ